MANKDEGFVKSLEEKENDYKKIKRLEGENEDLRNKNDRLIMRGFLYFFVISTSVLTNIQYAIHLKRFQTENKFSRILLEQTTTPQKLIEFYNKNHLQDYIVPKETYDSAKDFSENQIYLEIPKSEMKRIINENKLERGLEK